MATVVNLKAEERALAFLTNKSGYTLRDLHLHLFKNDISPARDDVAGTYTEADFTGYSSAALVSADWTINNAANPVTNDAATKNFTSSANQALQNIYGWYITTDTDSDVLYAERFSDAPKPITNLNDNIPVTIRLTAVNG